MCSSSISTAVLVGDRRVTTITGRTSDDPSPEQNDETSRRVYRGLSRVGHALRFLLAIGFPLVVSLDCSPVQSTHAPLSIRTCGAAYAGSPPSSRRPRQSARSYHVVRRNRATREPFSCSMDPCQGLSLRSWVQMRPDGRISTVHRKALSSPTDVVSLSLFST